jgi:hypothetical protein
MMKITTIKRELGISLKLAAGWVLGQGYCMVQLAPVRVDLQNGFATDEKNCQTSLWWTDQFVKLISSPTPNQNGGRRCRWI